MEEDEYLTRNSVEFHTHSGYRLVGEFYDCGYKFGRWYNMVRMEKRINTD
nr:GNAT family N-acetyltransferase [[Ruminococcus] lactaris]